MKKTLTLFITAFTVIAVIKLSYGTRGAFNVQDTKTRYLDSVKIALTLDALNKSSDQKSVAINLDMDKGEDKLSAYYLIFRRAMTKQKLKNSSKDDLIKKLNQAKKQANIDNSSLMTRGVSTKALLEAEHINLLDVKNLQINYQ